MDSLTYCGPIPQLSWVLALNDMKNCSEDKTANENFKITNKSVSESVSLHFSFIITDLTWPV